MLIEKKIFNVLFLGRNFNSHSFLWYIYIYIYMYILLF